MIYNSTYDILLDILDALGGDSTKHFDSSYEILLDILVAKGGTIRQFDSSYEILLAILEQLRGSVTKQFNSSYDILLDILDAEGGDINKPFDSSYEILLDILEQVSVSSPYNEDTTAILQEVFPAYWSEIKDYGLANPDMVQYINNDAYLICSLMDVGVTRWLVGDGTNYLVTDFYGETNDSVSLDVKLRTKSNQGIFGARSSATSNAFTIASNVTTMTVDFSTYVTSRVSTEYQTDTLYHIENSKTKRAINDTVNTTLITNTVLTPAKLGILGAYLGTSYTPSDAKIKQVTFNKGGTTEHVFVPYNASDNGTVYKGMLDLYDFTFYHTNSANAFSMEFNGLPYLNISDNARNYIITTYGESAWESVKTYFSDASKEDLVQYVNEDADFVVSLGLVSGKNRFLVGDGTAYIDTLFTPNNNSGIYAKFKYATNDYGGFFGVRTDLSSGLFLIQKQSNLTPVIGYNTTRQTISEIALDDNIHEMSLIKNVGTFDETTFTFTASTFTCIGSAILMGFRNGANILAYKPFVSEAKIWDNGTLIRNFVPCKNPNNSDYGMLDLNSLTYFGNANSTGAFSVSVE